MLAARVTNLKESRDNTMSILKGIGIVLVVLGHSGCPELLRQWIYCFHMPLFFLASGWFFKEKNISTPLLYTKRKVNDIYVKFVIWSIVFLVLHNFLFKLYLTGQDEGIYSVGDYLVRIPKIIFLMSGYDMALLGVFWFLRVLLVGCVATAVGSFLICKVTHVSENQGIIINTLLFCLMAGCIALFDIRIPGMASYGYRECMGVAFVGGGYIINKYNIAKIPIVVPIILFVLLAIIHPTEMYQDSDFFDWIVVIITGASGFIITYRLSLLLNNSKVKWLSDVLIYIGNHTFIIFSLHFLSFKLVSLIKIYIYGYDINRLISHPVITDNNEYFWMAYLVVGVVLPLLVSFMYNKLGKTLQAREFSRR